MLYNGERSILRITLENSSPVPVDFIKLSFDDSTVREAQAIFAEGEIPPEQAYELDHDLKDRPVFRWDEGESEGGWTGLVAPGGRTTLTIRRTGQGRLVSLARSLYQAQGAKLTFESARTGYSDRLRIHQSPRGSRQLPYSPDHLPSVVHSVPYARAAQPRCPATRRTKCTVVDRAADAQRVPADAESEDTGNQMRIATSSRGARTQGTFVRSGSYALPAEDDARVRMQQESGDGWCLLSLGIRNVYGVPFEVALHRADTGKHLSVHKDTVLTLVDEHEGLSPRGSSRPARQNDS